MKRRMISILMTIVMMSVTAGSISSFAAESTSIQETVETEEQTLENSLNEDEFATDSEQEGADQSDSTEGNTYEETAASGTASEGAAKEQLDNADIGITDPEVAEEPSDEEEPLDEEETSDLEEALTTEKRPDVEEDVKTEGEGSAEADETSSVRDENLKKGGDLPLDEQADIPEKISFSIELPGDSADVSNDSSDDELLGKYLDTCLLQGTPGDKRKSPHNGENLDYHNRQLYNALKWRIEEVAAGSRTSAVFSLDADVLSCGASDCGIEIYEDKDNLILKSMDELKNEVTQYINNVINLSDVIGTLSFDCQEKLFWWGEKEVNEGEYITAWWDTSELDIEVYPLMIEHTCDDVYIEVYGTISVYFFVSPNYKDPGKEGTDEYDYSINIEKIRSIQYAIDNARQIVTNHSGEPDYLKLTSYKDEICQRVSYNHDAWDDGHALMEYGDPWQIIYVFDGDSSTNVVCEGYSKAFQYLCKMSTFSANVECYIVKGMVNFSYSPGESEDSGEGHMWNIVKMGDGNTYIADITNCDSTCIDFPNGLFLVGQIGGSVNEGYQVLGFSSVYLYSYSDYTKKYYSEDELTIHQELGGKCGDYLTWKLSGNVAGEEDNLTLTISGKGDMYNYAYFNPNVPTAYSTGDLPPWVSDAEIRKRINRIVVKEGVTSIGNGAFSYVGSPEYGTRARIDAISLPSSLYRIGWYAFYYSGCDEITIGSPNKPVSMGYVDPKTRRLYKGYGLACSNFRKVNICMDDDYGWDFNRSTVESIVFLEGTETIPNACFESCEELQNVTVAKSVTAIDGRAFSGCHDLAGVDIPSDSNLESIGFEAFMNCYGLETITLPENLGIIDNDAFENCTSLESIDIPDSVNSINNSAFKGCTGLRTAELSAGIGKISYGLFSGCENLETITIPNSVTEIASAAFQNCKKLTRIVIPASVRNAGIEYSLKDNKISAFAGAENLVEIAVASNNTTYKSYDGCLYNSDLTELLYCPEGKAKIVFAPSTTVFTGSTFRCGEAGTGESKLKELYFGTCSPELLDNAFGISKIKATAYYNNFLNTWPSGKRQNYGGQITWVEKALDLSDCSMTVSPTSYTYDGTAKKPAVSLVYGGKNLTYSNDYTVSYNNNINAGIATVTATGVGAFTGTATKNFIINAATPVLTGWQTIDGEKYYFDKDGSKHIGWLQLGDKWYYFRVTGVMHTGMLKKDGIYYYMEKSGVRHSGWLQVNGKLYYFKTNGQMLTGWLQKSGKMYYFKTNGEMLTGWLQKNGKKFYFKTNGQMLTGWLQVKGKLYYFKENGQMVTGRYKIGNKWFTFNSNGVKQ